MRNVLDVAQSECWSDRAWLVAGKGPSFDARVFDARVFDARVFDAREQTLALNHVIHAVKQTQVLHCVDLEVADECATAIIDRARYLLMPWCPNIKMTIQNKTLAELVPAHRVLAEMNAAGRLLAYNRRESPVKQAGLPTVSITYFSAEGAFGVLAACGVRQIETTGIDGGSDYAAEFKSMKPLQNGQMSFDGQLPLLQRMVNVHGIDWTRVGDSSKA